MTNGPCTCLKTLRGSLEGKVQRGISVSGGLGLLQMVSEPNIMTISASSGLRRLQIVSKLDIRWCATEDVGPPMDKTLREARKIRWCATEDVGPPRDKTLREA